MLNAIRRMLEASGPISNVYVDFLPDEPDAVGLFCWDRRASVPDDGTSTRFVQVRVRCADYDKAMQDCQTIATMLESGFDETPLPAEWSGPIIGRVRRWPILFKRDAASVTVYAEVSLWGNN